MPRQSAPDGAVAREGGHPGRGHGRDGGFTLLETLIALVVAAILSIGLVRFMASTHVMTAHADRQLAVAALETAVMAALPLRSEGGPFALSGRRGEIDWEMRGVPIVEKSAPPADAPADPAGSASPGATPAPEIPQTPSAWQRYAVSVTIRARGTVLDRVETIRLGKASGSPAP